MKADFSRNTFHTWRHYRRVLGQQGRVVIDADANEQTSIDLATAEQTTYDVIGPAGVPETSLSSGYDGGFQIGIASGGNDLTDLARAKFTPTACWWRTISTRR